jgi:hypothetical protein
MSRQHVWIAVAIVGLLLFVTSARAQEDPDSERGARPSLAYKTDGLDSINLFNGAVTANVPLGQTYHVNGRLSYSFMASFATNSWKTATHRVTDTWGDTTSYQYTYPVPEMNAGFGWIVTLGQLKPEPNGRLTYIAPDGSEHTVGNGTDGNGLPMGTRSADSSYLRLTESGAARFLDFPDGQTHVFDSSGRLTRMEDAFGNYVSVSYKKRSQLSANDPYPDSTVWEVIDSQARKHLVYFRPTWSTVQLTWNQVVAREMVDRVELASFNGGTATYNFNYFAPPTDGDTTAIRTSRRCVEEQDPAVPPHLTVSLLISIAMPEGVTYSMTYDRGLLLGGSYSQCANESGNITSLTLPTGGSINWTYQRFVFTESRTLGLNPATSVNWGVKARTVRDADGNVMKAEDYELGKVTAGYDSDYTRRVVTKEGGGRIITASKHYFAGCRTTRCSNGLEYGLPFTRTQSAGNGYLSTETTAYDAEGTVVATRRLYLAYENDVNQSLATWKNANQRLAYERTVFEDGTYADVTYSDFDGLGHYRKAVTGGNFSFNNIRTTFRNYNSSFGTYLPGQVPASYPVLWVLGTYDREWVSEADGAGNVVYAVSRSCFDSSGFLTSRRTYRNFRTLPQASAYSDPPVDTADLLAVFTRNGAGNLEEEQYLGGEAGPPAPAGFNCGQTSAVEGYRIHHQYLYGTLEKSWYVLANGAAASSYLADRVVDGNTGLVATARRFTGPSSAGLATTFTYDKLGRALVVTSPSLVSTSVYSLDPARITTTTRRGATVLQTSTSTFDVLGRLIAESRSQPGGVTTTSTVYSALGWPTQQFSWGSALPTETTYDGLGRVAAIKSPDYPDEPLRLTYGGVSTVTRTSRTGTGWSAGALQLSDSVTTEVYDRHGRLRRVTEPAVTPAGQRPVTEYSYDVAGHVVKVCSKAFGASCVQTRSFTYDNRGLLVTETQPENGTRSYPVYDARGHSRRRQAGAADGVSDLGFTFDRSERLKRVYEVDATGAETRWLKIFEYGSGNVGTNMTNGQLIEAARANWVYGGAFNVQVVEQYGYDEPEGRAAFRKTLDYECAVAPGQDCTALYTGPQKRRFTQSFTYDPLGGIATAAYPQCEHAPCAAGSPARSVVNTYSNGMLTGVSWTGSSFQASLTYHPSGLIAEVGHPNGVVDVQEPDAAFPGRPKEIVVSGAREHGSCVAPTFTQQPQSSTVAGATTVTLTALADAEDGAAITYRWYGGEAPDKSVAKGTGPQLVLTNITSTAKVWVEASITCGGGAIESAASTSSTVTVCESPTFSSMSQDRTLTRGQSVTLLTQASAGGGAFAYQWYTVSSSSATPISGATANMVLVAPAETTRYRVAAENACGAPSEEVLVTVIDPAVPPALVDAAYDAGAGGVRIQWTVGTSAAGIGAYHIRRLPGGALFQVSGTTYEYIDSSGLTAGNAYTYEVRAVDENGFAGMFSRPDLAVVMQFADDPIPLLSDGSTPIRAVHVSELRKAVDAARAAVLLAPAWTNYTVTGPIRAAHLQEIRNKLNEVRSVLGLPIVVFTDPVTPGTLIKRTNVRQLRSGVK